jgi:hypothetical protein
MFTTTAVVLTIGIARWLKWRTDEIRGAKLVALLGMILIVIGVTADRIEIPKAAIADRTGIGEIVTGGVRDAKSPAALQHRCHPGPGATWVICESILPEVPGKPKIVLQR